MKNAYQDKETSKLDRLSANDIDGSNGEPVTRNSSCQYNNQVTDCQVHQLLVDSWATGESNGGKNDGGVQGNSVVTASKSQQRYEVKRRGTYTSRRNHEPAVPRRIFPFFHVE